MGPDNIGGRVRAILIDNENPNLMYAGGVSGGLWYSKNAGLSWSQTEPGDLTEVLTVNCIVQDEEGYIYKAAVDMDEEMVEMLETQRQYTNNIEVLNTIRNLTMRTLNIGK